MEFDQKTVVITGGGSGIGLSAAKLFCQQGANVVIADISEQRLKEAEEELKKCGSCLAVLADVSSEEQIKHLYRETENVFGAVDILFANAGANGVFAPLEFLSVDDWDRTFAVNARGTFLTLKYAIPLMKKRDFGSVIINSSINGTRCFTSRGAVAYAGSKSVQETIGKMAALELAPYQIRVNVICPGATATNIESGTQHQGEHELTQWLDFPNGIIPLSGNEWSDPDKVAQAVLFLASERSSVITGTVLFVDGGQSLIM